MNKLCYLHSISYSMILSLQKVLCVPPPYPTPPPLNSPLPQATTVLTSVYPKFHLFLTS